MLRPAGPPVHDTLLRSEHRIVHARSATAPADTRLLPPTCLPVYPTTYRVPRSRGPAASSRVGRIDLRTTELGRFATEQVGAVVRVVDSPRRIARVEKEDPGKGKRPSFSRSRQTGREGPTSRKGGSECDRGAREGRAG